MVAERIFNGTTLERYPGRYIRFMYTWRIWCNLACILLEARVRIISINHICTYRYRNTNRKHVLSSNAHMFTVLNSSIHLANYAHSSVHALLCFMVSCGLLLFGTGQFYLYFHEFFNHGRLYGWDFPRADKIIHFDFLCSIVGNNQSEYN